MINFEAVIVTAVIVVGNSGFTLETECSPEPAAAVDENEMAGCLEHLRLYYKFPKENECRKRRNAKKKRRRCWNVLDVFTQRLRPPHSDPRRDDCHECGIYFRREADYENHLRRMHNNFKPYSCVYCEEEPRAEFVLKNSLREHVKSRHPERAHELRYKINGRWTCPSCGEVFIGIKAFEAHALAKHEGEKLIKCSHCWKAFFRQNAMMRHKYDKHPEVATEHLKCRHCGDQFMRSDVMREHEIQCALMVKGNGESQRNGRVVKLSSLPIKCGVCQLPFQNYTSMRKHQMRKHPGLKIFPCHRCSKAYTSNRCLKEHVFKIHGDEDGDDNDPSAGCSRRGRSYFCQYCNVKIVGATSYERHGKKYHPGRDLFHCDVCGEGFIWKTNMHRHKVCQHGESYRKCSHCSKYFSRIDQLIVHERCCGKRLAKEEGYFCDRCQKTFNIAGGSILLHLRSHHEYEKCNFCDKRFHATRNPEGLKKHVIRRHPDQFKIDTLLKAAVYIKKEDDV